MGYNGRVFDNHFHLNYNGDFLRSVDTFIRAGGNAINLTNLPGDAGSGNYYRDIYDNTVKMADKIRMERNIEVIVTIGPYPLDYFYFKDHGLDAPGIMKDAILLAAGYIRDGKADAIGEIGFPHFPVDENTFGVFHDLLDFAFSVDSDIRAPVVLHTHDLGQKDYFDIDNMARRHGISGLIVKHHARASDLSVKSDTWKSIPATRRNIRDALSVTTDFMVETDFVDDPHDSNRYLPADSVPKRKIMIEQEYTNADDILSKIFQEIPERIYSRLKK